MIIIGWFCQDLFFSSPIFFYMPSVFLRINKQNLSVLTINSLHAQTMCQSLNLHRYHPCTIGMLTSKTTVSISISKKLHFYYQPSWYDQKTKKASKGAEYSSITSVGATYGNLTGPRPEGNEFWPGNIIMPCRWVGCRDGKRQILYGRPVLIWPTSHRAVSCNWSIFKAVDFNMIIIYIYQLWSYIWMWSCIHNEKLHVLCDLL